MFQLLLPQEATSQQTKPKNKFIVNSHYKETDVCQKIPVSRIRTHKQSRAEMTTQPTGKKVFSYHIVDRALRLNKKKKKTEETIEPSSRRLQILVEI